MREALEEKAGEWVEKNVEGNGGVKKWKSDGVEENFEKKVGLLRNMVVVKNGVN